jgi:hypothetical protein
MGKYNDYKKYSPKTTQEIMTGTGNWKAKGKGQK